MSNETNFTKFLHFKKEKNPPHEKFIFPFSKEEEKNLLDNQIAELRSQREFLFHEVTQSDIDKTKYFDIAKKIKESGESFLLMKQVLERGRRNTYFFDDFIETDIYSALMDADIGASKIDGTRIRWNKNDAREGSAIYNPILGIFSGGNTPDFDAIISQLAQTGHFPESIETIHHELIHAKQLPNFKEIFKRTIKSSLKNFIKPKTEDFKRLLKNGKQSFHDLLEGDFDEKRSTELLETHAYRVANFPIDEYTQNPIIHHIMNVTRDNKKKSYKVKKERLEYAIEAIDTLCVLKFSQKEIGEMIGSLHKWDKNRKNYPDIEEKIQKELQERNINEEELNKMKEQYWLQKSIDRLKITLIAREEIEKWEATQLAKDLAE